MRVIFRGFIGAVKQFEEEVALDRIEQISELAEKHVAKLQAQPGGGKHMIEIEFPDETDFEQRFFRIGTDPRGMVCPIPIGVMES